MGKVKDSLIDTKEWLDYLDQLDQISIDYDFEDDRLERVAQKRLSKKKGRQKREEDCDLDF